MSPIEKKSELERPVAELQLSVVQHAIPETTPATVPENAVQLGIHPFTYAVIPPAVANAF